MPRNKSAGSQQLSVEDRVRRIVADHLDKYGDDVQLESRIYDDLGADSLDKVELIMAIETEWDIEVMDDRMDSATTVGDLVDIVRTALRVNS